MFSKVHSSSKNRQYLAQRTTYNNEPNIVPTMDVKTRWNSTHQMLKSALRLKKSLTQTSSYLQREDPTIKYPVIDENDWLIATTLTDFLEPFYQCK